MKPIAFSAFFTCGAWYSPVSFGVRWFSRTRWYNPRLAEVSHSGCEFTLDDGSLWVAESLDEGWEVKKSKLNKRLADGKKVLRIPIPDLAQRELQTAWDISLKWVGTKDYDYPLIRKLAARGTLLGRALTSIFARKLAMNNSTRRLDCSEGLSLLLWTVTSGRIDLRDNPRQPFGAVTPQSALTNLRRIMKARTP